MNLKDLTFEELKSIKLCVALYVDNAGEPKFPELLAKLKNYCIAYQSGLDFGKKNYETIKKVINNEEIER